MSQKKEWKNSECTVGLILLKLKESRCQGKTTFYLSRLKLRTSKRKDLDNLLLEASTFFENFDSETLHFGNFIYNLIQNFGLWC